MRLLSIHYLYCAVVEFQMLSVPPQATIMYLANVVQGYDTILPLLILSIFGQIVTRVRVPAFALCLIFWFEVIFIIFTFSSIAAQ